MEYPCHMFLSAQRPAEAMRLGCGCTRNLGVKGVYCSAPNVAGNRTDDWALAQPCQSASAAAAAAFAATAAGPAGGLGRLDGSILLARGRC